MLEDVCPPSVLSLPSRSGRPDTCEYGENCVRAHSVEEMQEWIMRAREAHKKRKAVEQYGLLSYQDRLLEEYRTCCSEVLIVSHVLFRDNHVHTFTTHL